MSQDIQTRVAKRLTHRLPRRISQVWARLAQLPLRDLSALLVLILLPFLVFWQVWAPNPADRIIFSGDILMGAYPTRLFVHRLLSAGMMPLWNPYQLGGMPLLGDVQVAPYYSLNLLLDLLYWGDPIPYMALELMTIFHYVVGGLFLYAYLRELGLRAAPALIGAIAFEFNGFFIGHRGHYNMLGVVIWLPGVLWFCDRAWRARTTAGGLLWASLAALTLSQLVMAGHPQLTLYCALFIIGYYSYRLLEVWQTTGWRAAGRVTLLFGLSGVLAGAIAAIALLPVAELLGRSLRSTPTYAFAAEYSLLPRNFVGLLIPDFLGWGVTEYRIYAGILTLLLAVVAWIVPTHGRSERRFFTVAALFALMLALGGFTIFHGIIYRFIPGFDGVRVSARAFYLVNLVFCVLAAFGAEVLLQSLAMEERRRLHLLTKFSGALVAIALLLGVGLYLFLMRDYRPVGEEFFFPENLFRREPDVADPFALLTQTTNRYLLFVLFFGGATLLLWLRHHQRLTGKTLALALALLMTIDVATYAPYHDTMKADPATAQFTIRDYATTILDEPWQISDQTQLINTLQAVPPHIRIDNSSEVLPDNYSAVHQIAFATGYNILDLKERFLLLTQWPYLSTTMRHDLLNTGYILTDNDVTDAPEVGAVVLMENSQGKLWQRAIQPTYAHFSTQLRPATTLLTVNGLLNLPGQRLDTQPAVALPAAELRALLREHWPATIAPSLYTIGTSGAQSPVDITVLSGGPIKYSAVMVDGVTVTPEQRGIVLAAIDPADGSVLSSYGFDTYLSTAESDRLAAVLNALPQGTIVALATYDEGTARLTDAAQAALANLGATTKLKEQYGAAYALIGIKGAAAGTVPERLGQEAVTLDVGIGAYQAEPASFVGNLVRYQPNRITLAVQNSSHGLLTVAEADYPGWQAYVDGEQTPIVRANGIQRGVFLPPSPDGIPHEVTFLYTPLSVRLGGTISIVALSAVVGLWLALLLTPFLAVTRRTATLPTGTNNPEQPQPVLS